MKNPFVWVSFGLMLGIVAEKYGGFSTGWITGTWGGGMFLLWFLRGRRIFLPLFIFLFACAGFLWARIDARVLDHAVERFAGPGRVVLRGTVDSLPEVRHRGKKVTVSFVLKSRSIVRREGPRRRSFPVSGSVQIFLLQSPEVPQVGDELRLYGELSLPRKILNPGEFDYASFLAQKDIYAVFQSIGPKSVRMVRKGTKYAPARVLAEVRRSLALLIERSYVPSEAAILKALVLGLRGDVSPEVRNQFMKTGTVHIFATANTKRDFASFSNKIIATYSP
jgi:predicted membrane metal-binding protein